MRKETEKKLGAARKGAASKKQVAARKTGRFVLCFAGAMFAMGFLAVPAYRIFCDATGWGGTVQKAERLPDRVLHRQIEVMFDSNVDPDLPWRFNPLQKSQKSFIGKAMLAYFEIENLLDEPVTGVAGFNVNPSKAGRYFEKVQCFCFTEQTLQPGQRLKLPVYYYISPDMAADRYLDDTNLVVLSYSFHRSAQAKQAVKPRLAQVGLGEKEGKFLVPPEGARDTKGDAASATLEENKQQKNRSNP